MKHIRNSFAHGLLGSCGNDFYLLDIPSNKVGEGSLEANASMLGIMSKQTFYKMIKALLGTNPILNKRTVNK